jgi:hypothetical protein
MGLRATVFNSIEQLNFYGSKIVTRPTDTYRVKAIFENGKLSKYLLVETWVD